MFGGRGASVRLEVGPVSSSPRNGVSGFRKPTRDTRATGVRYGESLPVLSDPTPPHPMPEVAGGRVGHAGGWTGGLLRKPATLMADGVRSLHTVEWRISAKNSVFAHTAHTAHTLLDNTSRGNPKEWLTTSCGYSVHSVHSLRTFCVSGRDNAKTDGAQTCAHLFLG